MKRIFTLLFVISIVANIFTQDFPFSQRNTWDGPFDIKMISAPNLQPVILNTAEAERGGVSEGFLLADQLIDNNIHRRTGDLFDINNRFKDGSNNSVFEQYDIPYPALLCTEDPNEGNCFLGLDVTNNNSSCPEPLTRYQSNPLHQEDTYVSMTYADYDSDLSTFSSSMASLDISDCSEIEAAYLYWTGNFQTSNKPITLVSGALNSFNGDGEEVFNIANTNGTFDEVKFKLPGQNYQSIVADTRYTSSTSYVCVSDVTTQLQGLQGGGAFWVADLKSYPIEGNGGSTSGWTLVVVFKSPLSPPRLISLWDGFKNIGQNDTESFTLTGLQAPASDNFKSYVGFAALDGENLGTQLDSDEIPEGLGFKTNNGGVNYSINPFATDQPHYKLYNNDAYPALCNGSDNISSGCREPLFDADWCDVYDGVSSSHITTYDETTDLNGNEIVRFPNNINTLGYDAHHMKLPDGAVTPDATSATLTVSAGPQGSTLPFLAYLAIEKLQPKLILEKFADKNSTSLETVITYSFTIKNEGNAPSLGNDHIYDTLDVATTYLNGSLSSLNSQVSLVSSSSNYIDILIENPIAAGDSIEIQFDVNVIPFSENPALFSPPSCKRTIENTAYLGYNTPDSGILFSKSNSNDCGIGSETKILLIDTELSSSTTIEIGDYEGCNKEGESILDELSQRLLDAGYSKEVIVELDFRGSDFERIRPNDVFPEISEKIDFFAINEQGGGTECQEIYRFVYECAQCSVSVTSPDTVEICTLDELNYVITTSDNSASVEWSRLENINISTPIIPNQNSNAIIETLENNSNEQQTVIYSITPSLLNCVSIPFELRASVKVPPIILDTFIYCNPENPINGSVGAYTYIIELEIDGGDGVYEFTGASGDLKDNKWVSDPIDESLITNLTITDGDNCSPIKLNDLGMSCRCPDIAFLSTIKDSICLFGDVNSSVLQIDLQSTNVVDDWQFRLIDEFGNTVEGIDFTETQQSSNQLIVPNIVAGNYQVVDVNGNCEGASSNKITISNYKEPKISLSGDYAICDDNTDVATLNLEISDADFPTAITVLNTSSGIDTVLLISESQTSLSVYEAGIYQVSELKDAKGCVSTSENRLGLANVQLVTSPLAIIYSIDGDTELGSNEIKEKFVVDDEIEVLANTLPTSYIGNWQIQYFGTISNRDTEATRISNLTTPATLPDSSFGDNGVSKLLWIVLDENGICSADTSISKIVKIYKTEISTYKDSVICESNLPISYESSPTLPVIERSYWIDLDGAIGQSNDTIFTNSFTISNHNLEGVYRFEYIIENDFFTTQKTSFKVQIDQTPNEPSINEDIVTCKDSEQLSATNPDIGQGEWSCNNGTISNASQNITQISNLPVNTITTCLWTVNNGVCPQKQEPMVIERRGEVTQPTIFVNGNSLEDSLIFCKHEFVTINGSEPNVNNGESSYWTDFTNNLIPEADIFNANQGEVSLENTGQETLIYTIESTVDGCGKLSDTVNLYVVDYPVSILTGDTVICETQTANFQVETNPGNAIEWFRNNELITENELNLEVDIEGSYWATVNNGICPTVTSDYLYLRIDKIPEAQIYMNGDIQNSEFYEDQIIEISANQDNSSYSWQLIPDLIDLNPNSTNTIDASDISWSSTVILTRINGACYNNDTLNFFVKPNIIAPNVFTVNGDGINETFHIIGIEAYRDAHVTILNRWGNLVYETIDYASNEWTGGGLPEGVYYFIIDFDNNKNHTGIIHLIR